jgi:2-phosphosulfolactate phosphatase
MDFSRADLETCSAASGAVVVIDVLRAFSTAAYAFGAGASEIVLADTIEAAFELKRRWPEALLMGEVDGYPVPGFDLGNSPVALETLDLSGMRLIQRTSHGVQGIVRTQSADFLLAASFCNARATARYLRLAEAQRITFVVTGAGPDEHGDEDAACADYLEALLCGAQPDVVGYIQRVYASPEGRILTDPDQPAFPEADLEYCVKVDQFNFAMLVQAREGLLIMAPVTPL